MTLIDLTRKAERVIRRNSPAILSALGVSGAITTAYLAGKASYKAANVIRDVEQSKSIQDRPMETREKVELVWKLYIPAGISGASTIGCIIMATRIGNRRTAAVGAAYSLSELAFNEYREKIVEQFGDRKEQSVRDQIAQDRVTNNSPDKTGVIMVGSGDVLCCELYTGRYFTCDMEKLRKAQNDLNAELISRDEATLNDFYYLIGLPGTLFSGDMGWTSNKLLELEFSTVLSDDKRPCIAFTYNYIQPF